MFIPELQILRSDFARYDYIQANESPVMEGLFASYMQNLIAENAARAQGGKPLLNVVDIGIDGGGDTFIVRILVTTAAAALGWAASVLPTVQARFWMGGDAEALGDYQEAAIASLRKQGYDLEDVAAGLAGAAKGARFMAFIAAAGTS